MDRGRIMTDTNGWPEYAKHVLAELKRHNKWIAEVDSKLDNHILHIQEQIKDILISSEKRLTRIETFQKWEKWIFGVLFILLGSIITMLASIMIS